MTTFHDFKAADINGAAIDLAAYEGSVVLVVNTASKCGFTPQYAGLQRLHDSYADQGFVVLGFPCDQFGHQEPGRRGRDRALLRRGTTASRSRMFAKVEVNGEDAHPLYQWLKSEQSGMFGGAIKWNFTKFLIGRDGLVINRYGSTTKPGKIRPDIEAALA